MLNAQNLGHLFVPFAAAYNGNVYLHVRYGTTDPGATAAAITPLRTALRSLNPDLPVLLITPFANLVEKNIGLWIVRLGAILFGVFGGIALVLAVVGVYGVKSYSVARRTREIGIRLAVGAQTGEVFALIMKQGTRQTLVAVTVGLLLSLAVGQLLAKLLYEISPADPIALGGSAALLAAASLLACWLPARRATKVDPMVALRAE